MSIFVVWITIGSGQTPDRSTGSAMGVLPADWLDGGLLGGGELGGVVARLVAGTATAVVAMRRPAANRLWIIGRPFFERSCGTAGGLAAAA